MSNREMVWTAEQVEHMAMMVGNCGMNIADTKFALRAYAATLRQQTTNPPEIGSGLVDDGVVSDEVVLQVSRRLDKAFMVEGGSENLDWDDFVEAVREAVAPLIRAPVEQESAISPQMGNATACTPTMDRGGRVDAFEPIPEAKEAPTDELWNAYVIFNARYRGNNTQQALRDAVNNVLANRAALAQNTQGEEKSIATVRVTHGGYGMELSTHVAYALPEGVYKVYARPVHAERARVPVGVMRKAVAWETLGADGEWCRITQREFDVLQSAGIGQQRKLCLHEDSTHE